MYRNVLVQTLEGAIGYLAWAVVCYLTLSSEPADTPGGQIRLLLIVAGLLVYIVGFYFSSRDAQYERFDLRIRQLAYMAQFLAVVSIRFETETGVIAILSVALAAQLPFFFSRQGALVGLAVLVGIDFGFTFWAWELEDPVLRWTMVAAFHAFAMLMSQRVIQEQEARDQVSALNRELLATQALLEESAKQTERIRIARDLHDGLGHKLTALILKLQYLTHTTEGETQKRVGETHELSRALLSDVRETVHQMRGDSSIRLKEALEALVSQVPRLRIELDLDPTASVADVEVAEALFRCIQEAITNTLKHGNASRMTITTRKGPNDIQLFVADNGGCQGGCFEEGDGLRGMRERIEALRGRLDIATQSGFALNISIPVAEAL
ncbi:hypothetical protein BGP77_04740 [Saccharospirillum sp. MSK14-1]|uniref:sensor histidine kinase n=1 Tax=Saccharospirillum sp. MSK14-1 TaxID=1897632 RepID=UPI000D46305B|nr:sensor histidine kinase [Saccharospirillum sp. MSK14-1]PTY36606.1 hypothetical protein BGP77_04740 [Saccharospirillum sp. MSK14-1]